MSKRGFILLFLYLSFFGNTQTLEQANNYFDRYEYGLAYDSFLAYGIEELSLDEKLKYIYSSYVIGAYEEVHNALDPIIGSLQADPFFNWAFAQSCSATGRFGKAKENYLRYKGLVDVDPEFVDMRIRSADAIIQWEQESFIKNSGDSLNSIKGDLSGYISPYGMIHYREIGLDSAKNILPVDQNEKAELLLLKPSIIPNHSDISHPITLPDSLRLTSINSLCFVPNTNEVFISYSEPISNNEGYMSPHLYLGEYDVNLHRIDKVQKWKYSGFEDSSACAHVSINSLGTKLAFSKKKRNSDHADIYISERRGDEWIQPQAFDLINSKWNEVFPLFQQDGSLCFSSNGRIGYGKLDIYNYSFKTNKITHLKGPINGPMDDFNYFKDSTILAARYTSNRFNGTGDDDIYQIIYDSIPTEVVELRTIDIDPKDELLEYSQLVHFNFDKSDPIEAIVMDSILLTLIEDSGFKIHLDCHADERGTDDYNQKLSQKRGEKVKESLMLMGVPEYQIVINALGESAPLKSCSACNEEEHAENRVVRFSIKQRNQKDAL